MAFHIGVLLRILTLRKTEKEAEAPRRKGSEQPLTGENLAAVSEVVS